MIDDFRPILTVLICCIGIVDYCNRYGETINRVMSTFGPLPSMSSDTETVRRISAALEERIPVDKLPERRQWRIDRLIALAKIKKQMDGQ